jgi:hypothetical protein
VVDAALLDQGVDVHTVMLLAVGATVVGHRILRLLGLELAAMSPWQRALVRRKWRRPLAVAMAFV